MCLHTHIYNITHLNLHFSTCMHTHTHTHTHTHPHTHTRPTQVSTSPSSSAATVNVKNKIYIWLMKIQVRLLFFTVPVTNYCIKCFFLLDTSFYKKILFSIKDILFLTENYLLGRNPLPFSTSQQFVEKQSCLC